MLPASLAAKWLPREFVEATRTGGAFTVLAYLTMLVLFIVQLRDFLKRSTHSSLLLDFNAGTQMQINFDIDMLDIECRNLQVVVVDELREEPIRQLAKEYTLHTLDNKGQHKGLHSRKSGSDSVQDDEWARHKRRQGELETQDGKNELDSDWASSHDGFKHKSFEHVIEFHDFTLINFFAEWCVHCRHFAPKWNEIAAKVNDHKKFVDKDGQQRQVKALKMNCVDFKDLCRKKGIDAFPTIRLYKSDGTFSIFEGDRNEGAIIRWIELVVRTKSYNFKSSHEEFETGCNVKGFIRVPRVPGHLELMAGGGDQNLEPSMTNVSHRVRHLAFCVPDPSKSYAGTQDACGAGTFGGMSSLLTPHNAPLNGKSYTTSAYHQVYEHHLRLVTTMRKAGMFGRGTSYQFSHYGRTAKVNESDVPQARFYFDFEPFALLEDREQKQWYQFGTSLFAILGGVFVTMRLFAMMSISVASTVERSATPAGARKNGLLT